MAEKKTNSPEIRNERIVNVQFDLRNALHLRGSVSFTMNMVFAMVISYRLRVELPKMYPPLSFRVYLICLLAENVKRHAKQQQFPLSSEYFLKVLL